MDRGNAGDLVQRFSLNDDVPEGWCQPALFPAQTFQRGMQLEEFLTVQGQRAGRQAVDRLDVRVTTGDDADAGRDATEMHRRQQVGHATRHEHAATERIQAGTTTESGPSSRLSFR